jgi:hypothetical protein
LAFSGIFLGICRSQKCRSHERRQAATIGAEAISAGETTAPVSGDVGVEISMNFIVDRVTDTRQPGAALSLAAANCFTRSGELV